MIFCCEMVMDKLGLPAHPIEFWYMSGWTLLCSPQTWTWFIFSCNRTLNIFQFIKKIAPRFSRSRTHFDGWHGIRNGFSAIDRKWQLSETWQTKSDIYLVWQFDCGPCSRPPYQSAEQCSTSAPYTDTSSQLYLFFECLKSTIMFPFVKRVDTINTQ